VVGVLEVRQGHRRVLEDLLAQADKLGVKLPLDLLSALPQSPAGTASTSSTTTSTTSMTTDAGAGTVLMRGADPTLGGLLEGSTR
jgi:phospholipid/cholesterol/gamma-HCH transport system substrate-binding protein